MRGYIDSQIAQTSASYKKFIAPKSPSHNQTEASVSIAKTRFYNSNFSAFPTYALAEKKEREEGKEGGAGGVMPPGACLA